MADKTQLEIFASISNPNDREVLAGIVSASAGTNDKYFSSCVTALEKALTAAYRMGALRAAYDRADALLKEGA